MLEKLADALDALADWNHDACDAASRGVAAAEGVKAGLLINATRVAIVGRAVAPPLFETMVVLGKERVVARLRRAVPCSVISLRKSCVRRVPQSIVLRTLQGSRSRPCRGIARAERNLAGALRRRSQGASRGWRRRKPRPATAASPELSPAANTRTNCRPESAASPESWSRRARRHPPRSAASAASRCRSKRSGACPARTEISRLRPAG